MAIKEISPKREEELLDKLEALSAEDLERWIEGQTDKDSLVAYIQTLLTNGK